MGTLTRTRNLRQTVDEAKMLIRLAVLSGRGVDRTSLTNRLVGRGYTQQQIDQAVQELKTEGYISER